MKKVIAVLIFLIGFSYKSYARDSCLIFEINLTNFRSETCHLSNMALDDGINYDKHLPPLVLEPGITETFKLQARTNKAGKPGVNLLLTYQCGLDREITLRSQQTKMTGNGLTGFNAGKVNAELSNIKNMMAIYTADHADCYYNTHGTIHWKLLPQNFR